MNIIYIKFKSKEDQVKGYYQLAMKHRVLSLPNEVYGVTLPGLQFLEELNVSYRRATDDKVTTSHDQIRNPSPLVLQ